MWYPRTYSGNAKPVYGIPAYTAYVSLYVQEKSTKIYSLENSLPYGSVLPKVLETPTGYSDKNERADCTLVSVRTMTNPHYRLGEVSGRFPHYPSARVVW